MPGVPWPRGVTSVVGAIHELPLPVNPSRAREMGNIIWRGTLVVPGISDPKNKFAYFNEIERH